LSNLLSSGVLEIKGLSPKTAGSTAMASVAPAASVAPVPAPSVGPVEVSFDDDPVIGDKNAPITMVEFSDYECPFCKRYFDQTWPELMKNYVDTGKMKIVYRDYPLSFHQNAHIEAEAANCAREQGGDTAYFKYHDIMFKTTTSNGTGLSVDQLPTLATQVGLNGPQLKTCLDSGKYKDEVDKDMAAGTTAGVDGTPSFFIGKSGDGKITGTRLVGAQPTTAFTALIDQMSK
jgi:protein-disulfide isomerase